MESDVPWLPATVTLRADVQVFHVDPDPAKASMPLWSYPVDVAVQADGPAALAAIAAELKAIAERAAGGRQADRGPGRRGCVTARPARPRQEPDSGPLTPLGVMSALNQVIDAEDIVIEEAVTNAAAVYEGLERTRPGTLTGPSRRGSAGRSAGRSG